MSTIQQQAESKTKLVMFNIIDGEHEYLETLPMQMNDGDELEQAYQKIADIYSIDENDKIQIIQNLRNDEMAMIDCRGIDGVIIQELHTVKVTISGGVVQSILGIPPEFQIQIYDYDVEENEIQQRDEDGKPCSISTWTCDNNC